MSYIGKVKMNNKWQELEALIQTQVEGQSAFSFDSAVTYQIQSESKYGARLCEAADTPADDTEGFVISGDKTAHFKPETGLKLYVRHVAETTCPPMLLKISTLGEE